MIILERFVVDWFPVTCRCGKQVERKWPKGMEGDPSYRRLAEMSACKSCEIEVLVSMDSCPETVYSDGGFSACGLKFRHAGPCRPVVSVAEMRELLGYQDFKLADDE